MFSLPLVRSSLYTSSPPLLSYNDPAVSKSPVVYIHTSVITDAPDRSSLKTSPSLPGSMRPATEEPSGRGVAVGNVPPWSSTVCAPAPPALRMKHKETDTARRSIFPTDGNGEARCADMKRMQISREG